MKFTLLLILAFLAISPLAQYTPPDNAGVVVSQIFSSNAWENSNKVEYSYDIDANGNCRVLTAYIYNWDDQQVSWNIDSRTTYNYNEDGVLAFVLTEIIDSNDEWIPVMLDSYTYLETGEIDQVESSTYSNGWVSQNRSTYTYTSSGEIETMLYEVWNLADSEWLNAYLDTYEYDLSDQLIIRDSNVWSVILQEWQSNVRTEFVYESNSTTENYYVFSAGDWQLSARTFITYDANNKVLSEVSEIWQSDLELWIENQNILFTYDDQSGLILSRTVFMMEDQSEELGPIYQALYSDHCVSVGIPVVLNPSDIVQVIGNPGDQLLVRIGGSSTSAVQIRVYDAQGNLVVRLLTNASNNMITEIPVSQLAKGTYFVTTNQSLDNKAVRWVKQ